MASEKVYSKPGPFGKTILYNDRGEVIGSGSTNRSGTTIYTDTNGNFLGKSYSGSGDSTNLAGPGGSVAKGRGGYPGGVTKFVYNDERTESAGSGNNEARAAKPASRLFSFRNKKSEPEPARNPETAFIEQQSYRLAETPQGWFISECKGADVRQLTIPSRINGKSIVGIDTDTSWGRKNLEELIIPEGIEYIRYGAFAYSQNLKRVQLPSTLKELGSTPPGKNAAVGVFCYARNLREINLPDSLTCIGPSAFRGCWSLQTLRIPDSVTEISNRAFAGCVALSSIRLSKNIKEIPDYAFSGCGSLKQICIPDGVERIGTGAFESCTRLERVYIPASATSFGMSGMLDGGYHLDYTLYDALLKVKIYYVPNSFMHKLLMETRLKSTRHTPIFYGGARTFLSLYPEEAL